MGREGAAGPEPRMGSRFFPLKETRYGTLLFRQDERFVWFFKGVSCSGGSAATPQPNRSKVFGLCHGSNPHGDLV